MNLIIAIFINFFITFIIPISLYFSVLKSGNPPVSEFILVPGVCILVLYFMSILTSILASKEKCDSFKWNIALLSGIKTTLAIGITYAIIFLFPMFISPFIKISGPYSKYPVITYIAQAILLAFSTIPATTAIWFKSQKDGCMLSLSQIIQSNRKTAKELNKSPPDPNKTVKQVII